MEANAKFHIPTFDKYLAHMFEEIKEHIKINAQTFGRGNLPPLQNKKLNAYFEEDHLKYQALIDEVNKELQFKSTCDTVVEHKVATETRLQENNVKRLQAEEKYVSHNAALKGRRPPYGKWRTTLVWAAVILITLFDGLLAIPIFGAFGYNFGEAVCMGVLFGLTLAIIAHCFEKMILWGKTIWQRRIIAAILVTLLISMFSYMAYHRAVYLETQLAENGLAHVQVSPLPFVLLSTFLFLAAVALNYFYYPKEEQREAMHQYKHDLKAKQDNETEQQQIAKEKADIKNEHAGVRQTNTAKLEYGNSLELLIISHAHQGLGEWKKHNMLNRPDKGRPFSFDEPNYPFIFHTNFHSINSLK